MPLNVQNSSYGGHSLTKSGQFTAEAIHLPPSQCECVVFVKHTCCVPATRSNYILGIKLRKISSSLINCQSVLALVHNVNANLGFSGKLSEFFVL